MSTRRAWGLLWITRNRLEGTRTHLLYHLGMGTPLVFATRRTAREHAIREYGYIRHRRDLRREPHGWRMPRPVRLRIQEWAGRIVIEIAEKAPS